ncbi:dihydrofolate reductase [bacterium]|nr:dihydrofolate reductase [bacterium]
MIAACGQNGELGRSGQLPWERQPADMDFFRGVTTDHTIVMGRKTAESLRGPLPRRRNLVLTTAEEPSLVEGFEVVSYDEVLNLEGKVFIIGGEQIYRLFLPHADEIILTEFEMVFVGCDAFFPYLGNSVWELTDTDTQHFNDEALWDFRRLFFKRKIEVRDESSS